MQAKTSGGSIIMIGSVSGTRPSPGTAAYGAAKAGLHHLVTSLAMEWAPQVRLNCVAPGLSRPRPCGALRRCRGTAAVRQTVPLQRMATPADVAGACLFLASPQASYVSGATLLAARRRRTARVPGRRARISVRPDGSLPSERVRPVYPPRK